MSPINSIVFGKDAHSGTISRGEVRAAVPWWSFTKTVLAACALRLAEEGKIALNQTVDGQRFTLRQILQNKGGITNYSFLKEYHEAVERGEEPWQPGEMLRRVHADELLFEPGAGWSYSNIGFMYVRYLIAQICDDSLDNVLRENLFAPLGLETVGFAHSVEDLHRCVWGNKQSYHPGWVYHGLLVGSAKDAVELLDGLFQGKILSQSSRDMMMDEYRIGGALEGRPWQSHGYGLGLMMGEVDGLGQVLGHSGAGPLNVAAVYHFPDLDGSPTVAAFAPGEDEAVVEQLVVETARTWSQPTD